MFYDRFSGAKPDDRMQFQTGAGSLSGDGLHKGAPAIGNPNPVSRGFGCVPLCVLRCVEHIWAPAALIMISTRHSSAARAGERAKLVMKSETAKRR